MLGELVLTELRDLDQVAYVRFASVYRQFKSIDDFINELQELKDEKSSFKFTDLDLVQKV